MNRKKNGSGLGRRWRILRNLGITALLGVALWASRGFPLPTAELRFEWAQRGALMADPAPLQGQVGSELVGANERDIVVYSEGSWEIRTFPRTPGPALVPLSDGVVAVDVPEGTASARLEVTVMADGWYVGAEEEGMRPFPDPTGESEERWFGKTYSVEGELLENGATLFQLLSGDSYTERNLLHYMGIWEYYTSEQLPYGPFACHMTAVFYDENGAELGRAELKTTDF